MRDKPLLLMLPWLGAKHSQVKKYATLYLDQGFDVILGSIAEWQVLWPTRGSHVSFIDLVLNLSETINIYKIVARGQGNSKFYS